VTHAAIPATRPGRQQPGGLADRLGMDGMPHLPGAACARRRPDGTLVHDPDTWFPNTGTSERANLANSLPARQICRHCPARQACLNWALERDPIAGVWGGLTEGQRGKLRNDQKQAT
jgi:WhiB family redox-sensing transcriptional regulator